MHSTVVPFKQLSAECRFERGKSLAGSREGTMRTPRRS